MAELRRRLKRGLAGFLALCMTITSFTGISWADENISYDVSVKLEGAGIWKAAQEAITNGTEIPLGEELDESDTETARFYGLFAETGNKGSVFEMALDYEYETGEDEDVPDGADFSAYVRTKKHLTEEEAANYKITGEEQIIFLFYNYSEAVLRYQLHIDEQFTSKIRVNKYEMKLETEGPGLEQNKTPGGAGGQTPEAGSDVTLPAEGTVQTPEETTVPEETTAAPEESTSAAPEETLAPAPEETLAPETTTAPEETSSTAENTDATPVETPAPSPEETTASTPEETKNPAEEPSPVPEDPQTSVEDPQNTDSNEIKNPAEESSPVPEEPEDPSEEANETLSMSRNNAFILMAASLDSEMEAATASQINSTASPSNGEKINGEVVKRDTFDEDGYNVTVFAVSLKDIPKIEESNYQLLVEHDLTYGGKIYYDEQIVVLSEDAFDENLVYNFSNDVYESETYHKGGLLLKTPEEELKVSKDSFVYNEETAKYEAKVIIDYGLEEGWQVVDDKIEEVKPISFYYRTRSYSAAVEKQAGIQTMAVEKEYPEYLTPQMLGDYEDIIEQVHFARQAVGEKEYHYSNTLKKYVCGVATVFDTYSDRKTHYIILVDRGYVDPNQITYMRCDMYNKEEPEDVYYTVSFFDDMEIAKPQMITAVGDGEKVETGLIQGEREIPTSTAAGLPIAGWYVRGEPNKIYDVTDVKGFVVSGPVDFIAVIQEEPQYTIKYMGKNTQQEFISSFPGSGIQDTKKYNKNEQAKILGSYGEYQHDQGARKKLLIGWSTDQKIGGNNQNIIQSRDAYDRIKNSPAFAPFGFGKSVTVSDYADKENKLVLYPVWGDLSWAKISIIYEVKSDQTGWGNVDPKKEELYFYETPKGSIATSEAGYEFDGWYKGNTFITKSPEINPPAENATYTARFKELDAVEITYKAVNGTIIDPEAKNGIHSEFINPVTGAPKGIARPLNDAYVFDHWENSNREIIASDWLSTNNEGDNVIAPKKDEESGRFVSDTYTAYYRLKSNGSLTIGKELSDGSISLEGLDENQIPSFEMIVTLEGVGDAVISVPEGAIETEYTDKNAPKDFDVDKDREYRIFVKVGKSVVFGNIPRNVIYSVKEDESSSTYYQSKLTEIVKNFDIKLSSNPVTGEFVSNASQNVVFRNKVEFAMIDGDHPLVINKKLKAAEPVDNVSFVFKIENIDENSPKYGEIFYTTINIEEGDTGLATLTSIPVSKAYKVTEESHMRYQCSPEWYLVEIGTGANDGKPKCYVNGNVTSDYENSVYFENSKNKTGYFSDSYMLVNKMHVDKFENLSYPGTKDSFPVKTLALDYQPHAIIGLGIDKDKIFENMDNGDNELKSFVGTTYGL